MFGDLLRADSQFRHNSETRGNQQSQWQLTSSPARCQTNGSTFTSVQAFDITGRVVYASDATGNSLSIDVSNWNNGIYLVQIATENGVQVKRIVVN